MHDDIEQLRRSLPELIPVRQYCEISHRSMTSAYGDLRRIPDLGIKVGAFTRIKRDVMLREMAKPAEPWVPVKDRPRAQQQPSPQLLQPAPPQKRRKSAAVGRARKTGAAQ